MTFVAERGRTRGGGCTKATPPTQSPSLSLPHTHFISHSHSHSLTLTLSPFTNINLAESRAEEAEKVGRGVSAAPLYMGPYNTVRWLLPCTVCGGLL